MVHLGVFMKIGDRVKTFRGEFGTIVRNGFGMYDWTVAIEYKIKDTKGFVIHEDTMNEPYTSEELKVIE